MRSVVKNKCIGLIRDAVNLVPAAPALLVGTAGVSLVTPVTATAAVLVHNWNIVIPNNIDGLYLNVETHASGTTPASTPGWDLNPYGTSTTAMSWFGAATPSGCVTGLGQGGSTVAVASLSVGYVVGPSSTPGHFGNTASSVTAGGWKLNSDNYFGFRFKAADNSTHYGYGLMTIGATMGVRTLQSIGYESIANTPIVVPEPEETAAVFAAGAVGLAAYRRLRRRAN